MQRAVTLDPFSFWANRLLGSMLLFPPLRRITRRTQARLRARARQVPIGRELDLGQLRDARANHGPI